MRSFAWLRENSPSFSETYTSSRITAAEASSTVHSRTRGPFIDLSQQEVDPGDDHGQRYRRERQPEGLLTRVRDRGARAQRPRRVARVETVGDVPHRVVGLQRRKQG